MQNSSISVKAFISVVFFGVIALVTLQYTLNINITTIQASLKRIQSDLTVRWVASSAGDASASTSNFSTSKTRTMLVSTDPYRKLDTCLPFQKHLKKHVDIDVGTLNTTEYENENLKPGGLYTPVDCEARHRVAVLVPYRDRETHLKIFLRYMHPFLQRQNLTYGIYVIESIPDVKFNRALLLNIGFVEATKLFSYDCFIFHDVDLLPENIGIPYTCEGSPLHLSVAIDDKKYKLPYHSYFGGACAFSTEHFKTVNGFSNIYFDWGGEDDDMHERIKYRSLKVGRLSADLGRYKMLPHQKAKPNPDKGKLFKSMKARQMTDGLNSLKYRVLKQELKRLYTWILVSVNETEIVENEPIHKKEQYNTVSIRLKKKPEIRNVTMMKTNMTRTKTV